MKRFSMRILPTICLGIFSVTASAGSFQLWEQNASGLGTAYAGSAAVADNASTIYYNPAALTQLEGFQLSVGVSGVAPSYKFNNQGSTGLALGPGGSGGDAGGLHFVPNLYVSARLNEDLSAGFGISVPFGMATEYSSNNWLGSAMAIKSEIRTVNYNPSLAYRLNDKVSLGFGINYQKLEAEMSSMTPFGVYRVEGVDSAWGWNAGVLFTLSPAMRVGLSYRSAMDYHLDGTRSLNGVPATATANLKVPDTAILSVWQQVSDRWEAMGDLSYTRWSTLDKLVVQSSAGTATEVFNYKNSWRLAWGAAYKATDAVKLKFGIAYDRTPVQDAYRSARVPDNDRVWFSLGSQWNTGRYGKFDLGYAYLYVKNPSINQTQFAGTPLATTLRGTYDTGSHLFGLQYSVGF